MFFFFGQKCGEEEGKRMERQEEKDIFFLDISRKSLA